ncbi:hypothetical protein Q0Z83_111090 [Actinoplanes sichuanensis]|uniref:Tetratricopeptide repeat protein n=1 Tax=Actinoplanes sichuanensis TaxID=512349 RepID=A0ABW4A1U3_9ACTN|nr:hypothetical protein [Actinoplanes sichuanensis]BEL12918.1 hypothetical protein Q0Z83_111090 [Actinoplanes sichuanensis]
MTGPSTPHDGTTVDELGSLAMTAFGLAVTGHPADAAALLAPAVKTLDHTEVPSPALIDVSILYATLTTGPAQLRAAHYAYHASHRLYQCGHPRRLAAADAYGIALHQHGRYTQAVAVRRRLLAGYRVHQPQASLSAAVGFAASLHAAGHCRQAQLTVCEAWDTWRHHPDGDLSTGTTLLRAIIRLLRSCRRDLDLIAVICQARDTPAWDDLVITHTTTLAAADADYIDTHRGTLCTHTPQQVTRTSAAAASNLRAGGSSPAGTDPRARPGTGSVAYQRPSWHPVLRAAAILLPALALVLHLVT